MGYSIIRVIVLINFLSDSETFFDLLIILTVCDIERIEYIMKFNLTEDINQERSCKKVDIINLNIQFPILYEVAFKITMDVLLFWSAS